LAKETQEMKRLTGGKMLHASDTLNVYIALGLLFSLVVHLKDRRSHIDEWKHSSIDFEEDFETRSFWFKKKLNKVLAITFQTCILVAFWPIFLTTSIMGYMNK
jgi:hypothetical protein